MLADFSSHFHLSAPFTRFKTITDLMINIFFVLLIQLFVNSSLVVLFYEGVLENLKKKRRRDLTVYSKLQIRKIQTCVPHTTSRGVISLAFIKFLRYRCNIIKLLSQVQRNIVLMTIAPEFSILELWRDFYSLQSTDCVIRSISINVGTSSIGRGIKMANLRFNSCQI